MNGVLLAEGCEDIAWNAGVGERAGCAVSGAAQSTLETLFNWLVGGATWAVKWTGTAWLSFPEPTIGTADGTPSDNIAQLWSLGSFYIMGIAIIGFLIGVARLALSPSMQTGAAFLRGIVVIIAVQTVGVGASVLLLDAGNQFSVWVVEEASGKEFDTALADFSGLGGVTKTLMAAEALNSIGSIAAFAIVGFLLLLIAAFAQVCLLIVRSALLVVLMAFLPFLAAASFTDGGYKALSRGVGWIVALILYKPVAGIIYAVGVLTLKNAADVAKPEDQMLNLLIGVVIVAAAALALPALVKFVAPQAAAGASMAFSGGAVAAGAIGTGAAIVAVGATVGTGGAAAPAGAAATEAAGTGTAGAGATEAAGSTQGAADAAGAGSTGNGSSDAGSGSGSGSGNGSDDSNTGESGPTMDGAPQAEGASEAGAPPESGSGTSGTSGTGTGGTPSTGSSAPEGKSTPAEDGPDESETAAGSSGTGTGTADGSAPSGAGSGASDHSSEQSAERSDGSSSDAGDTSADGAESTTGAPPAQASGSSGRGPSAAQMAGAVRDTARNTKSGADDVDFNEGQGQGSV